MLKFSPFNTPVQSRSSGEIKAANSSGVEEIIHGFSDIPTGLVTEQMLPQDQRLLTVAPYDAKPFGLLFNGADARVSWARLAPLPVGPNSARPGAWEVDGHSWTFNNRLEALALYDRMANRLREGCGSAPPNASPSGLLFSSPVNSWKAKSIKSFKWVAMAAAAFVLMAVAFDALFTLAAKPAPAVAQAEQKPLYTPIESGVPDEARATAQEIEQIKALTGKIAMRESGIPVYVFTDPNCPYCLDLEKSLEGLDAKYNPVIIPLGFKPGSNEKSSGVLCQDPSARARAWSSLMSGGDAGAQVKACEAGGAMVAQNQMLFGQLRLSATPTLITPSGIFVSGSAKPDQLAVILER